MNLYPCPFLGTRDGRFASKNRVKHNQSLPLDVLPPDCSMRIRFHAKPRQWWGQVFNLPGKLKTCRHPRPVHLQVELLESRLTPAGLLIEPLNPGLDQFGQQIVTVQAYGDPSHAA